MQGVHLRKYNAATNINFDLYEVDGVDLRVDAVHAAGDSKIMKDNGAEANTGSGFVDEGQGYSLALTATEMSAARIVIYLVDQTATKVWLDKAIVIETYGHASAQHAMDFDDAVRGGLTALPNAAADAAGGLAISDAGGLDLDALNTAAVRLTAARAQVLTDWINGGRLDLLLDAIPTTAMRGTDSALTDKAGFSLSTAGILAIWHQLNSAIVTAGSMGKLLKDEITSARMAVLTDWIDGGRLDLLLDAIPTTAMRGTDNAALDATVAKEATVAALNNLSSADVIAALEDAGLVLLTTTIATLASQTSFTLTAGSADNAAYRDCIIVIEDAATAAQKAVALVSSYTAATKTIALASDPGIFTMAATDKVRILPMIPALSDWINGGRLDLLLDAIPTTAMRGTDSAATAAAMTTAQSDLDDIQTRLPAALVGGRIDADVGAKTGNVALSAQEKLDVNAEAKDVIDTDTHAEVGQEAPAATQTLLKMIQFLYKQWRNKAESTATTMSLYDDAGTTVDQKATLSDDATTATKGEIATGP